MAQPARTARSPRLSPRRMPRLEAPGWTRPVREALLKLIRQGSGHGLPVTLDFDNTILCGDIGEATMAILTRRGLLDPGRIASTLSPRFRRAGGRVVEAGDPPDLTRYYEEYSAPTVHGSEDSSPLANAYTWAVEIMEGLRVSDVVGATVEAMAGSRAGELPAIEVTPGLTLYPAPYFHPEMIELIAVLMRHHFEVWVVSASNVWSVRCLVLEFLNPLLRSQGVRGGLAADRVIGASTLLRNRRDELFKDAVLVRQSTAYANLDRASLRRFVLTSRLQFPVPTYSGKVGAIWDAMGCQPFLGAGDSAGDHAMLTFSQNRLWIARMEKPRLQGTTVRLMRRTDPSRWLFQPTLSGLSPGFVPNRGALKERADARCAGIRSSMRQLACYLPGRDDGQFEG